MKSNILLYGGKSTAFIVYEMLKDKKKKVKYIFDEFIQKPNFKYQSEFSNKKSDLNKFIKNSKFFFICIGMLDGKLRDYISRQFIKKKLNPLSIRSRNSLIDKSCKIGHGFLSMPNVVVHKNVTIGNNCYLNVNSVIDHETIIGNGVHIMGSAYIAGRVKISDFASIGANATILPDIKIGKGAVVGAGSVVTKDVKPNEIVVGNPAKFLKFNVKKYNLNIF